MSVNWTKSQVDKVRAFYARNTDSVHPDMPNHDMDYFSDEEVMAQYEALVASLEDMLTVMRKVDLTYPEITNKDSWIYQIIQLQDALLEDILLG